VFQSSATNLVSGDTNGQRDIFVKDMSTGSIRRVNLAPDGSESAGGEGLYLYPTLSADGRYISFESTSTNLVAGDTNAAKDIFVVANPLAPKYSISTLHSLSLATQGGSNYLQDFIDGYINELNDYQGQLGAAQSRMRVANEVLSSMNIGSQTAESRIRDADVAQESSTLIRSNIIRQAASAVLAQANLQPNLALQLLG
jgi:flagellin-like hook-associated protein FlgL